MMTLNVTAEQQGKINDLLTEVQTNLSSIVGKEVDITFLVHPSHHDNEPCQGTVIMTLQHPLAVMTSIIYAANVMQHVIQGMEKTGNMTMN